MIRKLHEDGEAIKQIFDHFRNVGIAAVVVSASSWTSAGLWNKTAFFFAMSLIQTILLIMVGLILFILNFRQGQFLLDKRIGAGSYKAIFARIIYGLFIFALFGALASGVRSLEQQKSERQEMLVSPSRGDGEKKIG